MNVCDPGAAGNNERKETTASSGHNEKESGGGGGRGRELAARGRDREPVHRAQRTLMYGWFCMRADELRGLAAGRYPCHSLQAAGLRSASVSILRSNAVKRGLNEMLHVLSKIELRHSPRYKPVR